MSTDSTPTHSSNRSTLDETYLSELVEKINTWGQSLGFQQVGICDIHLEDEETRLQEWLDKGYQAGMTWMGDHGNKRSRPDELMPGAQRVISVRMNYLPDDTQPIHVLKDSSKAYIARYTLGRDYHKLMRKRLAQLAKQIEADVVKHYPEHPIIQRPFVDSAPVMERPLAAKAGLGWQGKHTLIINESVGSWFFLGDIITSLPLPINTTPVQNQCGDCDACLKVCPTDAFPKPYVLDAGRCISYLTIEHKGEIPEEFREPIGNRIFGCDDCQAICPWNKHAQFTDEDDFHPRHNLGNEEIQQLFLWDEDTFLKRTEGSAIRRTGYEGWNRNLAIALGNSPSDTHTMAMLEQRLGEVSENVDNHLRWALERQRNPRIRKRKIKNPER